ncbi:hypothetical protein ACJRO7_007103 [Eucalyptus globulus]|uniref:Uncharacterized protein n=1 Tax=Eucalyptus globulus TaxID=34317 RepID=A0ABD3IML8_EUCGL
MEDGKWIQRWYGDCQVKEKGTKRHAVLALWSWATGSADEDGRRLEMGAATGVERRRRRWATATATGVGRRRRLLGDGDWSATGDTDGQGGSDGTTGANWPVEMSGEGEGDGEMSGDGEDEQLRSR